jgi:hypothetical protein
VIDAHDLMCRFDGRSADSLLALTPREFVDLLTRTSLALNSDLAGIRAVRARLDYLTRKRADGTIPKEQREGTRKDWHKAYEDIVTRECAFARRWGIEEHELL